MGVWIIGTGNITIKPRVEEGLIKEYIQFSKSCFPEEYGEEKISAMEKEERITRTYGFLNGWTSVPFLRLKFKQS